MITRSLLNTVYTSYNLRLMCGSNDHGSRKHHTYYYSTIRIQSNQMYQLSIE